ncbi:MAG: aminoacyl-tRNA hydrolase [Chitinophagales bacterium]|nr:aminoacyl-tRNA hydrolase [Chitinophagales bacterium]
MYNPELLHDELKFKAVRSGGKGGQHVNKVSSKIELYFDVKRSLQLNEEQKEIIIKKLSNRMNSEGVLLLESQETRSQYRNKEIAIEKFDELIRQALLKKKKRIKSKPSAAVAARRLEGKKKISEKKQMRSKKFDM